ncbi:MAG TPA: flagellar biosynthesis protein FlgH [Opitutae bacterium]|nr:flagellar biosynthesis protein FlgH [Opitutae bacterium]HAE11606.1 flagellar biosynthesis protein FlgH [Opitutae bacterium]HAW99276.1 flagellar biosynthesis protein FlgH [Opitutae bacterium]|tara:strand:- start:5 stop:646 length:642 start_codon:yes stop_codon:yes gene_type:complete
MSKSILLSLLFLAFSSAPALQAVSLWMKSTNSQKGLFVGKRAYAVGDLITIDVSESSSLAASQNSVRSRQSQVENAVKQFLFANSNMGKHNGGLPGTEIETKSSNKGGGSIANTQNLKGRVSVVVIDVLPNGVLVLEGARMVTFSGESYYAVLKGMVRKEDIGFGFKDGLRYRNIVSSQYIADAQIEFVSKGSLNDAQKESWYQRLATIINPF